MKKQVLIILAMFFAVLSIHAQRDCDKDIAIAKKYLKNTSPFNKATKAFELLQPCALQGHAEAENYVGMMYLKGVGIAQNIEKAFDYFNNASQKGYNVAQYNLGRMYKYGIGCELDFNKAVEWFMKASDNGNAKASYSLGYMYYKGFGVSQDYQKAVHWFKQSDDVMAKHFLGLCYYFGYGVTVNEEKALELWLTNPSGNSKTMVSYMEAGQKGKMVSAVQSELENNSSTNPNGTIPKEVIEQMRDNLSFTNSLTESELVGEWTGKLVQYDWSGEHVLRVLPIEITISVQGSNLKVQSFIEGQTNETTAQWQYEHLYLSNVPLTLTKLYAETPKELALEYTLLSIGLQKQEVSGNTYLVGNVDSFISDWTEYGEPMSVVLKPKNVVTNEEEELLLALATQEDQFIKLYPVPFNNQLTVQYQLETLSEVFVELVNLVGTSQVTILPTIVQQAGEYTYSIPIDNSLPEGLYVVRLAAGSQLYTRMIIKEN